MFNNVKRQDDASFQAACANIVSTGKSLWGQIANAAVQAILHYHEHGFDCSRCHQLYVALEDARLGSQVAAYSRVLREATGISGIGGANDWKGKGRDIPADSAWQEVVQKLIDGEGSALLTYKDQPKSEKKSAKTRAPVVKLPQVGEPVVNALQKVLDSKSPEQVTEIVNRLEKGESGPTKLTGDLEVDQAIDSLLHSLVDLYGDGTGEAPRVKGEGVETRREATLRVIAGAQARAVARADEFDEALTASEKAVGDAARAQAQADAA